MKERAKKTSILVAAQLILILVFAADIWAQPTKVYVAHPAATLSDAPYYVALDKGFYREEGLEVLDIFVEGGVRGAQALMAGSIHFSLGLGSGTRAAMMGAPLKGIFGFNEKPIHSLFGRADRGVKSPPDLKGKRIAVTSIGSSTDYAARAIMRHFGLNADKDATIVALGGGTTIWSAIKSGSVEAAILWPPYDALAEQMGMTKILYLGDIITLPASGIVAADKFLKEDPALAKRFLRATLKGLRFFQNASNREENGRIMAKAFQLEKDIALRSYDFLRPIQTRDGILPFDAVKNDIESARERIKDAKITALSVEDLQRRMYDFAPLQEILREEKGR
jgi:ABC-type nitrate/sulfonate/bicarbonate transport system substrate-binding protein